METNRKEYVPSSARAGRGRSPTRGRSARASTSSPDRGSSAPTYIAANGRHTLQRFQRLPSAGAYEEGGPGSPTWEMDSFARPQSAVPLGRPRSAWSQHAVLKPSQRKVHVGAILANRPPELMAEDVVGLKEQLHAARERERMVLVEKRRLEAQLSELRSELTRADELLQERERTLSPTKGLRQMYVSPDTTHLVRNLKEHAAMLKAARDQALGELSALQKSTRATAVVELQKELIAYREELGRQARMAAVLRGRVEASQAAAASAVAQAQQAARAVDGYILSGGVPALPPRLPAGISSLSATNVRKTLQALHVAHRAMLTQVQLIKASFRSGLSWEQFDAKAAEQVVTSGATDVLRFIRTHQQKLMTVSLGLPGMPTISPSLMPEGATAGSPSSSADRAPSPSPSPTGGPRAGSPVSGRRRGRSRSPTGRQGQGQGGAVRPPDLSTVPGIMAALADHIRGLRAMDEASFMSDSSFETHMEQLADVAQLLVEEVRRLQGGGRQQGQQQEQQGQHGLGEGDEEVYEEEEEGEGEGYYSPSSWRHNVVSETIPEGDEEGMSASGSIHMSRSGSGIGSKAHGGDSGANDSPPLLVPHMDATVDYPELWRSTSIRSHKSGEIQTGSGSPARSGEIQAPSGSATMSPLARAASEKAAAGAGGSAPSSPAPSGGGGSGAAGQGSGSSGYDVSDVLQALGNYMQTHKVQFHEVFERFDHNGDGRLQLPELAAFLREILPGVSMRQVRYFQVMLDYDGDSSISKEEFARAASDALRAQRAVQAALAAPQPSLVEVLGRVAEHIRREQTTAYDVFTSFDRDGNSRLDALEITTFLKAFMPDCSQEEIRHLAAHIYTLKRDTDGMLSYSDLLSALRIVSVHLPATAMQPAPAPAPAPPQAAPPSPAASSSAAERRVSAGGATASRQSSFVSAAPAAIAPPSPRSEAGSQTPPLSPSQRSVSRQASAKGVAPPSPRSDAGSQTPPLSPAQRSMSRPVSGRSQQGIGSTSSLQRAPSTTNPSPLGRQSSGGLAGSVAAGSVAPPASVPVDAQSVGSRSVPRSSSRSVGAAQAPPAASPPTALGAPSAPSRSSSRRENAAGPGASSLTDVQDPEPEQYQDDAYITEPPAREPEAASDLFESAALTDHTPIVGPGDDAEHRDEELGGGGAADVDEDLGVYDDMALDDDDDELAAINDRGVGGLGDDE